MRISGSGTKKTAPKLLKNISKLSKSTKRTLGSHFSKQNMAWWLPHPKAKYSAKEEATKCDKISMRLANTFDEHIVLARTANEVRVHTKNPKQSPAYPAR